MERVWLVSGREHNIGINSNIYFTHPRWDVALFQERRIHLPAIDLEINLGH